jgi:hypothetical protein
MIRDSGVSFSVFPDNFLRIPSTRRPQSQVHSAASSERTTYNMAVTVPARKVRTGRFPDVLQPLARNPGALGDMPASLVCVAQEPDRQELCAVHGTCRSCLGAVGLASDDPVD